MDVFCGIGWAEDHHNIALVDRDGGLVAMLRVSDDAAGLARLLDRHSMAGRKSDHGDAVVLANILRTDLHAHRPLPAGSELAQGVAVLARA